MYERLTDRARKVMQLANQQAQRLNHEHVGAEHILLGLCTGGGIAAKVLEGKGVSFEAVQFEVEKLVQAGPETTIFRKMPRTPEAERVIENAMEEARNLNYVGTEHLLLGLLRNNDGIAAQVLRAVGIDFDLAKSAVVDLVSRGYSDSALSDEDIALAAVIQRLKGILDKEST